MRALALSMVTAVFLAGAAIADDPAGREHAAAKTAPGGLFVVHFALGPRWNEDAPPQAQPGFAEHAENLKRLREEGAIAFGARYGDLGMIVLRAASAGAARAMIAADPGVRSGIFVFELAPLSVFYPWE